MPPVQVFLDQSNSKGELKNTAKNLTVSGDQIGQQVFNKLRAELSVNLKQSEQRQEEDAPFSQLTTQLYARTCYKM